ncbi:phosphoribosyl-ATP diphosphatase [Methylocella sp.]|uniref:phosphoribosyl-ATP diphosphatase n=1 Tax=Methylocella sp. TaxID=1978226 RepID=UPI00378494B2
MTPFSLDDLAAIIADRAKSDSAASYTKSLLEAGPPRAAKKFGEEAVELVIAALEPERRHVVAEAADVVYHLLVLLQTRGVPLAEVLAELERRTSMSGHAEKAARQPAGAAAESAVP